MNDTKQNSKRKRLSLTSSLTTAWPKLLAGSAMVALVGGLLLFRLGSLLPAGPTEIQTIEQGQTFHALSENPLLAPYKLLVYVLVHLPGNDLLNIRLASVVITCLSVWLFFILARRWYGTLNSAWITVAFAASSWTLQTGRFGAGYCTLTIMVLGLLNLAVWLNTTTHHRRALIAYALVSGLVLFMPGGLWFILATTFILYKPLLTHRSNVASSQLAVPIAIFVAMIVAVASSLAQNTGIIAQWIGWPAQFPSVMVVAKQAIATVSYFVLKGPAQPENWLSHTPLLDVASTVLFIFGVLFYFRHLHNSRTRLLLGYGLVCMYLVAVNGAAALSFAIPLVYLVAGGGLAYIMHQWNRVFPRNPIAWGVALTLMIGLLMSVISFHTIRTFVAWRYSPDTIQAYSRQSDVGNDPYKSYAHLIQ